MLNWSDLIHDFIFLVLFMGIMVFVLPWAMRRAFVLAHFDIVTAFENEEEGETAVTQEDKEEK